MGRGRLRVWPLLVGALVLGACSTGDPTLTGTEASRVITDALEEETGQRPTEVRCPDETPVEAGETFRCTIVADDGSEIGATITFEDEDGTLDIQVDDELSSPPSG